MPIFSFYFVECGLAGQLHKLFAAPIFPLFIPLAWINSFEKQLYRAQRQVHLLVELCRPTSQLTMVNLFPLKTGVLNCYINSTVSKDKCDSDSSQAGQVSYSVI